MPLLFDLPYEQLKTYQGKNPRPADFDQFWDKGLAEMASIDPKLELKPATFQTPFAECFHLFFTGMDNARIHAKFLRPKHGEILPGALDDPGGPALVADDKAVVAPLDSGS